ncbi:MULTISPECIES: ABC transporter permease [Diplocloster]|uniref:ABC transporter permease n=1 Tax=Diplocloster modestus TaxID=2850322 RepID=A0ABS6KAI8_9FIRM|nr:ABC transporter permease [Diplocloster modestus]MBU9727544.1 ABC transporter permease [Diplocloster modestus]
MKNVKTGKDRLKKIADFALSNFVIIAFVILFIASCFLSPAFFTKNNLMSVLIQNSIYAICAIGMLVIIITGGIDLSTGAYVCITVCLTAGLIQDGHGIVSVFIVLLLALVIGSVSGSMVAFLNIAPFIATLAMTTILKGAAYMYQTGQNRRIDGTFLPNWVKGTTVGIPNPVLVMIIVYLVFLFVLNRTRFGRGIYAIGGNKETAYLAGIKVKTYLVLSYALGGLCFAIAGILLCGRLGMGTATVGDGYEMDAIASVVIGGAAMTGGSGSVTKTIVGAMLMGVLYNIMNLMGIASYPQMIVKGVVIVLAVLLYKRK